MNFSRNESPLRKKLYSRSENAIYAVSRVKYLMCSCKSKSDSIIFPPRRVRNRLNIEFTINFHSNESPRETKNVVSRGL
jgi:hypothetical protein